MKMSEAKLSSTELINLLKSSNYAKFKEIVSAHFSRNRTDHVSGLKLIRTIANFAYDEKSQNEKFVEIVEYCKLANDTVIQNVPSSQLNDNLLKELFICSIHIMNRLIKLKFISSVNSFWSEFFKLSSKLKDQSLIHSRAYSLYAELWNFAVEREGSTVQERLCLIEIARGALEFQLLIKNTDKFSVAKFVDKVSRIGKMFAQKDSSKPVMEKLTSTIVELSSKLSDNKRLEDFAVLVYEIYFMFSPQWLAECLTPVRSLLGPGHQSLVEMLEMFTRIHCGEEVMSLPNRQEQLCDRQGSVMF